MALAVLLLAGFLFFFLQMEDQSNEDGFELLEERFVGSSYFAVINDNVHQRRLLMYDQVFLGGILLGEEISPLFTVFEIISAVTFANPRGKNALAIGLGVGSVPSELRKKGIITDCVEISKDVVDLATTYFSFRTLGDIHVMDGRTFLFQTSKRYDFIIHDIFDGMTSTHLLTKQVFDQIFSLLHEDGIFVLNFFGFFEGENSRPTGDVFCTLKTVFPHVRSFRDTDSNLGNIIFFSSRNPIVFQIPSNKKQQEFGEWEKEWIQANLETLEIFFTHEECQVITDENHLLLLRKQSDAAKLLRKDIIDIVPSRFWKIKQHA